MTEKNRPIAAAEKSALVVDDERLVRMLMVDALEVCGYRVLEAADGPAAFGILSSSAQIDLLVIDHRLPDGVFGRDIAETARGLRPSLRVLVVSGLPPAVVTANRALSERVRLLSKPFSMVKLVTTVAELMGSTQAQLRLVHENDRDGANSPR